MIKFHPSRIIFLLLSLAIGTRAQNLTPSKDSSDVRQGVTGFIATSFILNKNWNENNNSNFLLSANLRYNNLSGEKTKTITEITADIAYIKFIDSIWVKNNDRFYFSNIWLLDNRKIRQTISVNLVTQMTDTWIESESALFRERKWVSGPLLPMTIVTGYGIIYKPFPYNYINLSFPCYKIGTMPTDSYRDEDLNIIKRNSKYIIYHQYGFHIQLNISQKITSRINFENSSNLFIVKMLLKNTCVDIRNTLSFFPMKNFKLRIENRIVYDQMISESFQWKYDFLFGLNVKL